MGHYRYLKSSGWGHTGDIADNFKAIDFYDNFKVDGNDIFAETAVSMKTTTTKSVDSWLGTKAVQDNIGNLRQGMGAGKGVLWNKKTMFIANAEIHIYMPKANITEVLKSTWMNKLNTTHSGIKFEIKALEDFVN